MPDTDTTPLTLDPTTIIVDQRQRKENVDVALLEESVARVGFIQPIVITRDLRLIAGGRRLQVAINLGLQVPIIYRDELGPLELKKLELEENAKRSDLTWRDQTRALAELHSLSLAEHGADSWSIAATARSIGFSNWMVWAYVKVNAVLDDPRIAGANDINQALMILRRINDRRAASVVGDILAQGASVFGTVEAKAAENTVRYAIAREDKQFVEGSGAAEISNILEDVTDYSAYNNDASPTITVAAAPTPRSLLNQSFIDWSATYSGPKFNLIHCDFPYGTAVSGAQRNAEYDSTVDIYTQLCAAFTANFDRFTSYSAHVIFWFSMTTYGETLKLLQGLGLWVWPYPLVWSLTDGARIVPVVGKTPRRAYHTALLASRGERPTVKSINDSYGGPTVAKPIHPTQKPEPMLKHFLSLLVDETSVVLDPTCGSASALIAAESLGAKQILGLELDEGYFKAAEASLSQSRALRRLSNGS